MKYEKQENTPRPRMDSPTAKKPGESVFRLSRTMEITRKIRHQLKFETRLHFLRKMSEFALLTTADAVDRSIIGIPRKESQAAGLLRASRAEWRVSNGPTRARSLSFVGHIALKKSFHITLSKRDGTAR